LIPRSLGISSPEGKDVYEIYLKAKSRPPTIGKILNRMGERNVDILGVHVQVSDDKKLAHALLYVEMGGASVKIDELMKELKANEFVMEVRAEPKHEVFFNSMMFPLTSGGHYRVFALGGRGWVALVSSLLKTFGSAGGTILHSEGFSVGEELVDGIARRFKAIKSRSVLLKNFAQLFSASGYGILDISGRDEELTVAISNSVVSEFDALVMDQFLVGIVRGAISKIFGSDYAVENLRFEGRKIKLNLKRKETVALRY